MRILSYSTLIEHYVATYQDTFDTEHVEVQNEGATLSMRLRGVFFRSRFLDDWEAQLPYTEQQLALFTLHHGDLTGYTLSFAIPIRVTLHGVVLVGALTITLAVHHLSQQDAPSYEHLQLHLVIREATYVSAPAHQRFEDAFLDIQHQLPPDVTIQTCFFCGLSDYSPYGNGLFGCLACFRTNKDGYRKVKTKGALFAIWPTNAGFVQETFYCDAFEPRHPNTGYRG
jgi:Family of unknown function (DUF6304)